MNRLFLFVPLMVLMAGGCATMVSDYGRTARDAEKYVSKNVEDLDYDTGSYVIETKGGGAIACVNIGAKDGVEKGSRIEFYYIIKRNGERFEVVFATGHVFQPSETTSWVKVDKYDTAGVKLNHFARLSPDRSKNLIDRIRGWLGAY